MSLVLLCGTPGSGKTTRALELKAYLETKHSRQVVLVNEQSLALDKNEAYKDATAEKISRAQLKFETQKNLIGENIVILDSLNYIKGWRYQMYCIAREMKANYCVIFCNSNVDKCREFNQKREAKFNPEIFQDLTKRMEVPQLKNRWDIPLFERRENEATPLQDIVNALLFQQKLAKDPISTNSEEKMVGVSYLEELDQIVQRICEEVIKQQSERGVGVAFPVPDSSEKVTLTTNWTLIGLKKVKNQFLKVIKGKPIGLKDVGNSFVIFLKETEKRK